LILAITDVLKVDDTRWKAAQEFELRFAQKKAGSGDDYNVWWYKAFNHYDFLRQRRFQNVIEVGCGPHTNIRLILPLISVERLWL
jgi:hypothetical protein